MSIDLPVVKKDELNVSVHNGVLTISGTRHHKFESYDDNEKHKHFITNELHQNPNNTETEKGHILN